MVLMVPVVMGGFVSESFGNDFDVEAFMNKANAHTEKLEELEKTLASVVGRAQDEDNLVTAEYGADGLSELLIHPKAMRLSSGELAERVKEVVRAATADLQRQIDEGMSEVLGAENNPMRFLTDPEAATAQVREAEAAYNRTFNDVMGELDRISRRLDL
ncbi:YbaB/EbfC family nucleoid-associated protein [Streptosporangium soli]|nr:YbaB/EbfC family nucleoid-associated protein [Streptosporangium sp. KLBMP 9127]